MRFAIVDNQKTPPAKGLQGTCPACGSSVYARCGRVRVHHWAHKGERSCDPWWEPETPWHRAWKDNFAKEWQEVIHFAADGEKHIADVKNAQGLTVEFQHSPLAPEEREKREAFYGRMVWVVDGSRTPKGRERFDNWKDTLSRVANGIALTHVPEKMFAPHWLNCATPIFFDFHDGPETEGRTGPLYCLLPGRIEKRAVIVVMTREGFIQRAKTQGEILPGAKLLREIAQVLMMQELQAFQAQQRALAMMAARSRLAWRGPRRSRRF